MKKILILAVITSALALNIIGVVKADLATPFVDTAEVGEISTGQCWLISGFQDEYLVVVATDAEEYIVLSATSDKGVVDESLLGKPVILNAKVIEKKIRTDGNIYMLLKILSVKLAAIEQAMVDESKENKEINEEKVKAIGIKALRDKDAMTKIRYFPEKIDDKYIRVYPPKKRDESWLVYYTPPYKKGAYCVWYVEINNEGEIIGGQYKVE